MKHNTINVLIINPPSSNETYINRDLMGGMGVQIKFGKNIFAKLLSNLKANYIRIPVVQLVYATALLEKNSFSIQVIDAANERMSVKDTLDKIETKEPNYVIMAVSSSCILFERDIFAAAIKKKYPCTTIIVVGDMITEMPHLMNPSFDIGVIGEIEKCIVNVCSGKDPLKIPGLIVNRNGTIVNTENNVKLTKKEQEELPFPPWHLFPYHIYKYYPMIPLTPVVTIQASRGCPYGCGYCPYSKNQGKLWRARSAENIFKEIEYVIKTYNIKGFFFRDPLFSADKERVEKLCSLLIQNNLSISFAFETRPELLTRKTIDILKKAGCTAINFGIEDIHPEVLKAIGRKPIDPEIIIDTIQYCEKNRIRTSCFFIIGLPHSTRKSIEETIAFSKKLFASQVEYKIATPYPGTELYNLAKKNSWLIHESIDMLTGYKSTMQISSELSPEYLERRIDKAFKEYYFNIYYISRELWRARIFKNLLFAVK